jgi:hypothetical protein
VSGRTRHSLVNRAAWLPYLKIVDCVVPLVTGAAAAHSVVQVHPEVKPPTGAADQDRFAAGKALTKEDRKRTLDSLADVYKENGVEKVSKGVDRHGEEIFGYP